MADQDFVDPTGWRIKEQAAKLRDAAVAANAHVEDQLSALSRVRRAVRELENTAVDDPQREDRELELRQAQEILSAAQSASEMMAVQGELQSFDLGDTVAKLVEEALAQRPAAETAFVRIEDLDALVRAVVREELDARKVSAPSVSGEPPPAANGADRKPEGKPSAKK